MAVNFCQWEKDETAVNIFIFVLAGGGGGGRVTKRVFLDYVPWARLSKRGFWNVD